MAGKERFPKLLLRTLENIARGESKAISQETVCGAYPMGIHPFLSPSNWLNICRNIRHFGFSCT